MRLYVAGGCGEHGRNCFHVKDKKIDFLVDCGLMAGEPGGGYPHLGKAEIRSLGAVFLTHSHADHTGAIPWLYEQGFDGVVAASRYTLEQLPFSVKNPVVLEEICPDGEGEYLGMKISWGHSGHCVGRVWYRVELMYKAGSIFFSGDYIEHTQLYDVQPIRDCQADLAVLDCAYGKDRKDYESYCFGLIRRTSELLVKHKLLFFPVPKYGRGIEILQVLRKADIQGPYYGDEHFLGELEKMTECNAWYKGTDDRSKKSNNSLEDNVQAEKAGAGISLYTGCETEGIVFLSNPQLRTESTREAAKNIIARDGYGIMTGTVEPGTFSAALLALGKMELLRYPVHQNLSQYEELIRKNRFGQVIPYHTPDFDIAKTVEI